MYRIAIPISGDTLSENFNECSSYQIYEINKKASVSNIEGIPSQYFLGALPRLVKHYSITDVIAHSIDKESLKYINDTKINLFVGVHISSPDELIEAYLNGTLKSNTHRFAYEK